MLTIKIYKHKIRNIARHGDYFDTAFVLGCLSSEGQVSVFEVIQNRSYDGLLWGHLLTRTKRWEIELWHNEKPTALTGLETMGLTYLGTSEFPEDKELNHLILVALNEAFFEPNL